jgi:hypothetical protein
MLSLAPAVSHRWYRELVGKMLKLSITLMLAGYRRICLTPLTDGPNGTGVIAVHTSRTDVKGDANVVVSIFAHFSIVHTNNLGLLAAA